MRQGKLKVGAVPMYSANGNVEENLDRIEQFCSCAADENFDILCFPELAVTGQDTQLLGMDLFDLAEPLNGTAVRRLEEIARCMKMYLVIGMLQKSLLPGRLFSTQIMITPTGRVKITHQKHEMCGPEQLYIRGGIQPESIVYDFPVFRGGFLMGNEIYREDLRTAFYEKGAKVLFVSSAGQESREESLLRLAKESRCYVVEADNYRAYIISPDGKILQKEMCGRMIEEYI